jgi:hypothetical protein
MAGPLKTPAGQGPDGIDADAAIRNGSYLI